MKKKFNLAKSISWVSFVLVFVFMLPLLTSCSLFSDNKAEIMTKAQNIVNEVAGEFKNFEANYFPTTQAEATSDTLRTATEGTYQGDAVEKGGSMASLFADIEATEVKQYSEIQSNVMLADRIIEIAQNAFFAGKDPNKTYCDLDWVNPKSDSDRKLNIYFEYSADSNMVTFNLYEKTSLNQEVHARFQVLWTNNYDFILQGIVFADSSSDSGTISPIFVRVDKLKGASSLSNFELASITVNASAFKSNSEITISDINSVGTSCYIFNFENKTIKNTYNSSSDDELTAKTNAIKTFIANYVKSCNINNAGLSKKESTSVKYMDKFVTETGCDWIF